MQRIEPHRFFYGWIVVAVTALTLLISAGVRSAPGVFIVPMRGELAWSQATIAFAVSLGLVLFGLAGPATGWLVARIGLRATMVAGLLLITASMATSAAIESLWQLNLFWGALSGIGTGVVGSVLGATVAGRWFVARRGLVVGVFGAATSAGQLIFVPLLMWLAVTIGWRTSVILLGVVAFAALLPVFLFMRNDPADVGARPLGMADDPPATGGNGAERGVMRRAVRSPEFWLLSATFFVCGATSNGLIGTHLVTYAVECGIGQVAAAGALALMGTMNFVGTIASGWLTDRYDPRKLLCVYYGFRGLSLLLLPFVTNPAGLAFFAVLFGLDYIATVPPTTALTADTFGRRNVGIVFGWIFCAHQAGAAIAAWLGGVARDTLGDFVVAFVVAGALALFAGLLSLRIGRAAANPPAQSQPVAA